MRVLLILLTLVAFTFSCEKSKWNRKLAVKSGKWKLTRYIINDEDKTNLIPLMVLDFKDKKPGVGVITEFITDINYSKGYNSCFNVEGAVNIPNENAVDGMKLYLSFSNNQNLEDAVGFLEVDNFKYGSSRTIRPKKLTRTQLVFEFPYNLALGISDTSKTVKEVYIFNKLP